MRNTELWKPTKFIQVGNRLVPSLDSAFLATTSRIIGACQAAAYEPLVRRYAHGDLVDIGCGTVPLFSVYRDLVENVICFDWPLSRHGTLHLDVICDLGSGLPLGDRTIDTVICTDTLEHLPNPAIFWEEIPRVLRVSGSIVLGVPFLYWIHEEPHDYYRYTEYQLRSSCHVAGLKIVHLDAYGGSPQVLADLLLKHFIRTPRVSRALATALLYLLERRPIQRLSARTARRFPLGYALAAISAQTSSRSSAV